MFQRHRCGGFTTIIVKLLAKVTLHSIFSTGGSLGYFGKWLGSLRKVDASFGVASALSPSHF